MSKLSLRENILWNSFGSLVYWGCQWLISVLVVRFSGGYEDAGYLSLAMVISNVFVAIGLYKTRAYQVSDVKREIAAGEYVACRCITLAVGLVISIAYTLVTCPPASFLVVILYLFFRSGEVFVDVVHGVDQQHMRMDYCGKSMALRGVLFLAAFCASMLLLHNLAVSIAAMILATFPIYLLDWKWMHGLEAVSPCFNRVAIQKLLIECLPAVIGSSCCLLVVTVARQHLASVEGESVLGVYASVSTLTVIIQMASSYVYSPLVGSFALAFEKGRRDFYQLFLKISLMFLLIIAFAIVLFALAGSHLLSLLFGSNIAAYESLLIPAVLSAGPTAYIAFLTDILVAVREMRGALVGNAVSFAVSVPITFAAIPLAGGNGVSFSIFVSYFIGCLVMAWFLVCRTVRAAN